MFYPVWWLWEIEEAKLGKVVVTLVKYSEAVSKFLILKLVKKLLLAYYSFSKQIQSLQSQIYQ